MPLTEDDKRNLNKSNWKKPTGILKALNAFDTENKNTKKSGRNPHNKHMMKKTGNLIKVVNNFSAKGKPQEPSGQGQDKNERLRKVGTIAKTTKAINKLQSKETISVLSESNLAPSSPGILKSNLEMKKHSNTVKFSQKNDIKVFDGAEREKRKVSGNIAQQSKNILRNINKDKTDQRSLESESEGYHSDCSLPKVRARNVSTSRKTSYGNKRRSSSIRPGKGSVSSASANARHGNSDVNTTAVSLAPTEAEATEKSGNTLRQIRKHVTKNPKAKSNWNKIATVVRLARTVKHNQESIILLSQDKSFGWRKLQSALDVSKMANKYLDYRKKRLKKGLIPRGGGKRAKGSFDSLDRYRQHLTPKRYNPTRDMFIHTTDVRWRHYQGCTNERDPKSINSHVYLPWDKIVTEPLSLSRIFCKCSWYFGLCRMVIRPPWDVSQHIYQRTSQSLYSKLALPFMLWISLCSGFFFGTFAFVQIWMIQPFRKIFQLNGLILRKFTAECFGECNVSLMHILQMLFAGNKLNINTLNTELSGVFNRKQHCPVPLDWSHKRGSIKNKSKEKYPKIKLPQIPFMSQVTKVVGKTIMFMKEALEIAQSKIPSFEIMESAFRLAVVKRDERVITGTQTLKQSLRLARSRRGNIGDGDRDDEDFELENREASSLWGLAKRLAFARAKRGKTNWKKAHKKVILPQRKKKKSFWFQAKNIVFTGAEPSDRKIIKVV